MGRGVSAVIEWWKSRSIKADEKRTRARSENLEQRVLFSADLPWISLETFDGEPTAQTLAQAIDGQSNSVPSETGFVFRHRQGIGVVDPSYLAAERLSAEQFTAQLALTTGDLAFLDPKLSGVNQLSALLGDFPAAGSLELLTTARSEGVVFGAQTLNTNDLLNNASEFLALGSALDAGFRFNIQAQGLPQFQDRDQFSTVINQLLPGAVQLSDQIDLAALGQSTSVGAIQELPREIVFIDPGVDDYETLLADLQGSADPERRIEVVILDPARDGVEQITEILRGYVNLDAIHIVSHGSEGSAQLGGATLSNTTLNDYGDELVQWRNALSKDADLLFYGCDFAGNESGKNLVRSIAQMTGADVAASTDLTGAQSLGGDWDLEFTEGDVESQIAFGAAAQENWQQVLASESVGLSINQDGGNDTYLQVDDGHSLLNFQTAFTFETRFATTDTTAQALVSYSIGANDTHLGLTIQSDGNLLIEVSGDSQLTSGYDFHGLADGEPHTISTTWTTTSGAWEVFVDGVSVASGSGLASGSFIGGSIIGGSGIDGVLVLGNAQNSPGNISNASLAQQATLFETRLFDDVRTATEIADNHDGAVPRDEQGLRASWLFDSLSSNEILLEAVDGNNLTVMHATGAGFTSSDAELTYAIDEDAPTGTVIGSVMGVDPERDALIASLLAANPELHYSAETNEFYRLVTDQVSFDAARAAAEGTPLNSVNGQLATVRSAHENNLLSDIGSGNILVWLGGTDATVEGEWRWIESGAEADQFWQGDINGVETGSYANWFPGTQPAGGSAENALSLGPSTGRWVDSPANSANAYIIEWDADAVLDVTQPLTYTIPSQTVAGAFTIDSVSGEVSVADSALLDFETNEIHTLTVQITDIDNNSYNETLVVSLNDVFEASNPVVGQPAIVGTPTEDQTLTADTSGISDADGLGAFNYQWVRDGLAISGATGSTYTLGDADVDSTITLVVSYTDGDGTAEFATSVGAGPIANINDAPTGTVDINDPTPSLGDTITVSNTLADADGLSGTISYQWFRDGVAIAGATGSSYTLIGDDVGSDITTVASYIDDQGAAESVSSSAITIQQTVTAPTDLSSGVELNTDGGNSAFLQTDDGGSILGGLDALTVEITFSTQSTDELNLISYQASNDQNMAGITENDLFARITPGGFFFFLLDDVQIDASSSFDYNTLRDGAVHSLAFTWDNTTGEYTVYVDGQLTSQGSGFAVNQTLNGSPGVGSLLFGQEQDAVGGGFDPNQTFSGTLHDVRIFNEARTASEIEGNFQHSLDVTPAEAAAIGLVANYRFELNASNEVVESVSGNNLSIGQASGAGFTSSTPISGLQISEDAAIGSIVGNVFPSDPDVSSTGPSDFSFGLIDPSNNFAINSDTGQITVAPTHTLDFETTTSHDIDVTVTDAAGLAYTETLTVQVTNVNEVVVGQPAIVGTPTEDQTLSVDISAISDGDGLGAFSYQWFRDGIAISSATGATYTLGDEDVDSITTVQVSYTDQGGYSESSTSGGIGPIANINDVPTGSVAINNLAPTQGDLLAASNSLTDADGLSGSISYQWFRDGVAIGGATNSTYAVAQADVGAALTAVASYVDDQGTAESVSSASTTPVTNVNDGVVGQPVITGTPTEDQVLTADTTGISDADGLGTFSFQWFRDGVALSLIHISEPTRPY